MKSLLRWDKGVLLLVVLTFALGGVTTAHFLTGSNVGFVIQDIGEILLIACPMTFVIITGEIDLSVASTLALSACVMGVAFSHGVPMAAAVFLAPLTGAACGLFNGLMVTTVGLPSLVVTIGTLGAFRGLCYALLGSQSVDNLPTSWTNLGYTSITGTFLPWETILLAVVVAASWVVLHATRTGRWVFAIGQSAEAARFSGIPVANVKLWLFVASGTVSGLAGVVYSLRFASVRPDAAVGLELSAIAAALFGGVSIFGGVGTVWGVTGAVLFLGAIRSLLQLQDVRPNALTIITGALLLASVIVPAAGARVEELRESRRGPVRTSHGDISAREVTPLGQAGAQSSGQS
jgi:rhamnose transport system permease protein